MLEFGCGLIVESIAGYHAILDIWYISNIEAQVIIVLNLKISTQSNLGVEFNSHPHFRTPLSDKISTAYSILASRNHYNET